MSTRNDHELYAAYGQRGAKAAQNRDEAMALAKLLRGEPAYQDPKHPSHEIVKRDLKALYDGFVPNEPEVTLLHVNGRAVVAGGRDPQLSRAPVASPDVLSARWNKGEPLTSFSPTERVALRRMVLEQPGYRDPNHPEHAAFVQDAKALYALDVPGGGA